MGYSAKAVANYFFMLSKKTGRPITPLKMQKLVYIAHGWHLGITEKPLVDDEYPEAWEFGPVFPSLYHEFKHFKGNPIKEPARELILTQPLDSWDWDWDSLEAETPCIDNDDDEVRKFLDNIWNSYSKYSGIKLSSMSHGPGTPWSQTREAVGLIRNAPISEDTIKRFYEKRFRELQQRKKSSRSDG